MMLLLEFSIIACLGLSQVLLLPLLLILELAFEFILSCGLRVYELILKERDLLHQLISEHIYLLFDSGHLRGRLLLFCDDNEELSVFEYLRSLV
jgi:hypothetical protein